jgi:type I restriction enzyme S subunit
LRVENLTKSGYITDKDIKYISRDAHESLKRSQLEEGDLLVSIAGAIGRSALVEKCNIPANTNQAVGIVRLSISVVPHYIRYSLQAPNTWQQISDAQSGNAQINLNLQQLGDLTVYLPPLPEQKKIAAILSSVDAVIEKTQAQIDKLNDLKTGMMQELLTKGIGADGKPHTEFKDSPVGRIPVGWVISSLTNILENIFDCEHKTAPYVDNSKFLVVRTSNVRNGQLVFEDLRHTDETSFGNLTSRAVPREGDELFTREAPAGESCLVPEGLKICMGQRMVLLRPDSETITPDLLSFFLLTELAKKKIYELSIGTTVSRINIEDIRRIECLLPSLEEQRAIVNALSSIQCLINSKSRLACSVRDQKKALMQDLLTGKVRVKVDEELKEDAVS